MSGAGDGGDGLVGVAAGGAYFEDLADLGVPR